MRRLRKLNLFLPGIIAIVLILAIFSFQKVQKPSAGIIRNDFSIYYGVYIRGASASLPAVRAFEKDTRKNVSLIQTFEAWGDSTQLFNTSFANAVRANGSIPFISWVSTSTNATPLQPAYSLQSIINGHFDSYITRYAKQVKSWGHPLFLRLDQEMNDNWAPWDESVNGNKPGQFVAMWRHVHDIFTRVGVTNSTWVWCPGAKDTLQTLQGLYPGDAYVDWLCMDGYNDGRKNWRTFSQIFGQTYQYLQQISSKPIIIAETASVESGGDKAQYITDMLSTQLPKKFPSIKGFLWWNIDDSEIKPGWDWRIESSSSSQQAFAHAIASPFYASNSYGSISSSPIPPP